MQEDKNNVVKNRNNKTKSDESDLNDKSTKEVLSVRPDMLSMLCIDKKAPCLPLEFIEKYSTKYSRDFQYYSSIIRSRLDQFEVSNENWCSVLEYVVNWKNSYMIVCPHIVSTKSENP